MPLQIRGGSVNRLISRVVAVLVILLVSSGYAQEQDQKLEIREFKGLNTRASDFTIQPNEARIAHNIDLSRGGVGSISKRLGYDSVSCMNGMDSLIGVYGAYYRNGTQQLIVVADSDGVGYGGIYASPLGSVNIKDSATKIMDHWGIQTTPSFTIFQDQVYIVNGVQRGVLWGGTFAKDSLARNFPLAVPGEPTITPLDMDGSNDKDYYLSGEYRYSIAQIIYGAPRVRYDVMVDSAFNTKGYIDTITISGTPYIMSYTSDASATRSEIADHMVDSINANTSVNSSVTANRIYITETGKYIYQQGAYYIEEITDGANITLAVDTLQTIYGVTGTNSKTALSVLRSVISSPVIVDSGRVLITNIPTISGDTLSGFTIDSLRVNLFRSEANPGSIDFVDSTDSIGSIFVNTTAGVDTLSDIIWIDSLPDTAVSRSGLLVDPTIKGRDSTGAYSRRLGAPGFMFSDSVIEKADTSLNLGIYNGWPAKQSDTLGVLYACTFIDTITGLESDTGRSLFVSRRAGTIRSRGYSISLPQIPTDDSGLVVCLYRAALMQATRDSIFHWTDTTIRNDYDYSNTNKNNSYDDWELNPGGSWGDGNTYRRLRSSRTTYRNKSSSHLVSDSAVVGQFYLLDILPSTTESYFDEFRQDSLELTAPMYTRHAPPNNLNNVFPMDGRLFGTVRSTLSFSYLDSGTYWSAFAGIPVNANDGDEITTAYPTRGIVRVLKNRSAFNVYQDANLNWNRTEVSGLYGSIASRSYAKGFGGHYFLSDIGVLAENEGQYLERTQGTKLVSAKLNNFDKLSIANKSKAFAFYYDQKYMLSIGDTTYVYDEMADGWTTWSMKIADATLYGKESDVTFYPGDTMYFIKPGDSLLYRYGTAETDKGTDVDIIYHSAPFLVGSKSEATERKKIESMGMWYGGYGTISGIYGVNLYGTADTALNSYRTMTPTAKGRFNRVSIDAEEQLYYRFHIISAAGNPLVNLFIDGVDIYWRGMGAQPIE